MIKKGTLFQLLLGAVIVGTLWIPVLAVHHENPPKDDPKYIRRLFENHTVGQTIKSEYPLQAIEIIVRSEQPQTATIIALDKNNQEQGRVAARLTPRDRWVRIPLSPVLPAGDQQLTFRVSAETRQDAAVLVRFQIQSDLYAEGNMVVDGEPSYGDVAFRALERVPLWRSVMIWGQITGKAVAHRAQRAVAGVVIAAAVLAAEQYIASRRKTRTTIAVLLCLIALATILIRIPYLYAIEGVFGGDAFNYLSKANALLEGEDPFAADPRKGPLYSLLLLPGFFTADPLHWSRLIGIFSAATAAVLTAVITRKFSPSWALAACSAIMLAVNQDFIWESPSGLANTLYTALILASTVMYLTAHTWKRQWLLAVVLGLTFLTRYEGVLVAAVLLPALWLRERFSWKQAACLVLITGAVMAIPQVSLLWSGVSGIRTAEDLTRDEGLAVAFSWGAIVYNLSRLQTFISSTWVLPEHADMVVPALALGLVVGLGIHLIKRRYPQTVQWCSPLVSIVAVAGLLLLVLTKSSAAREYLVAAPWLLIGVGVIPWVASRRFDTLVVMLMVVVQAAIITLILPKPRYYIQLIPFLSIALIFGINTLVAAGGKWQSRLSATVLAGMLAMYFYTDGHHTLEKKLEKYNTQAQRVSVMIQTAKYLRSQEGKVGFRTADEQPIITYLPRERRFFFPPEETYSDEFLNTELTWIREKNVRYLVERDNEVTWQAVRQYPDIFEHLHTFDTIYGDSRVKIFGVQREQLQKLLSTF